MPSREPSTPPERSPPAEPNNNHGTSSQSQERPAKKKRIRNFTADDRAAHRVFEKSRRDAFRERLMELAGLVPTLSSQDASRLSKHVVVDESIKLHRLHQSQLNSAIATMKDLVDERDGLVEEVNQWRGQAGLSLRQPIPRDDAMSTLTTNENNIPDVLERRKSYSQQQSSPEMGSSQLLNPTTSTVLPVQQANPATLPNGLPASFPEGMDQPVAVAPAPIFNSVMSATNHLQPEWCPYDAFNNMTMSSQASVPSSMPGYMEGDPQESDYLRMSCSDQFTDSMELYSSVNVPNQMTQQRQEFLYP